MKILIGLISMAIAQVSFAQSSPLCSGSSDGMPLISNGRVRCDISIVQNQGVSDATFGLLSEIQLNSTIDQSAANFISMQTQNGILKIPQFKILGIFKLSDGKKIKTDIFVKGAFNVVNSWCKNIFFTRFRPEIIVANSGLASWVEDGIANVIATDQELNQMVLQESNNIAKQIENSTCPK